MAEFTSSLRDSGWMYILRVVQLILCLGALADTGSNVRTWHSFDCKSPDKLNYNVAIAVLVLPALLYLLLTTGPLSKRQLFLWSARRQVIIDGIFTVGWLVAATLWTTQFSCKTLCGLCSQFGYKHTRKGYYFFGGTNCQCQYGIAVSSGYNHRKLAKRASVTSSSSSDAKAVGQSLKALVRKAAKDGLDWPIFTLFLVAFLYTGYSIHQERKAGNAASSSEPDSKAIDTKKEADLEHS